MATNDELRQLNEAVIPSRFSLDAVKKEEAEQAAQRLSLEGNNEFEPHRSAHNGRIRVAGDANTEIGVTFRGNHEKPLGPTNLPEPRGSRGAGVYVRLRF